MSAAATYSVVEELIEGNAVALTGEGELAVQIDQEAPPLGSGHVRFNLRYAPEQGHPHRSHGIEIGFDATDDEGQRLLRWQPAWPGRLQLYRHDLTGDVEAKGARMPIRLSSVAIERAFGHLPLAMVHDVKGLLAGEGLGSEVVRARALVPNFLASTVETNTAGLHLRLEPISLSADRNPQDPAHAGNVIPTCLLSLERLEGYTGPSLPEAIEIFGWLLSFYAGRAVHPFAWEGETGNGRIWSIRTEDVDPLPIPTVTTCLQSDGLAPFLARAWVTWLSLGDVHQRRLRGVVNVYRTILANPFPTQKVALIATYLERFRALVVDNRTPLEKVNAREKKLEEEELAAFLKGTLKNLLVFVPDLSDQDLADLSRAIDRIQGGKMHDLLRPSFASTLMELYGRVRLLPINQEVLRRFIQERNQVIHGRWNADREGAMATFWWSEYGLNLLERLILRFFGYEGPYWNRVKGSAEGFEHRDPKW